MKLTAFIIFPAVTIICLLTFWNISHYLGFKLISGLGVNVVGKTVINKSVKKRTTEAEKSVQLENVIYRYDTR